VSGTLLGQAAVELSTLKFSRDAEAQADARAWDALVASGIDPAGLTDFFKALAHLADKTPYPILSTHPASPERERRLRDRQTSRTAEFPPLPMGHWPPP
jgi:predicted Zn-dependent protease